jgi:hypothetical protein
MRIKPTDADTGSRRLYFAVIYPNKIFQNISEYNQNISKYLEYCIFFKMSCLAGPVVVGAPPRVYLI